MSAQMLELIILFAIAAFVLYRLKSVIGTRTGFEGTPDYPRADRAEAPQGPAPRRQDPEDAFDDSAFARLPQSDRDALMAMREIEGDFHPGEFLQGARHAYEMIVMAFEEGDRQTLRNLLADDVYAAFEGAIAEREERGYTVEARFIGIGDVSLVAARFDRETGDADLDLRITGEMITAVRDAENRVVEGDPNEIRRQTDLWTFSRRMGASDPNWLLTATGD